MKQKYLAIALLFTLIISAIPIVSVKAAPPNADTFKYASIGMAETCDPAQGYDTASGELLFNVYEGLVGFDNEKVDAYIPLIAQSWPGSTQPGRAIIPSPPDPGRDLTLDTVDCDLDGIADPVVETWYFKINPTIKWQDPTRGFVTTSDCEYSFERGMVMDPGTTVQWMFYNPLLKIMSSQDLGDTAYDGNATLMGRLIDNAIRSNSTHVWFNLRQGYAAFMQILAQTWACVLDKEWTIDPLLDTGVLDNFPGFAVTGYINWRDYNAPADPGPLMDEERMMGSGPYKLDYWDSDPAAGYWQLIKFADYWRGWSDVCPLHPHVDKFYESVIAFWPTRKAAFIAGEYDAVTIPRVNCPELEGSAGIRYLPGIPTLAGDALFFNVDPDPATPDYQPEQPIGTPAHDLFADRHIRLGFMYMVNKTLFAEELYLGEATPIGNPIINGIRYYNATKPYYDYNLEKATYHFQMALGGQDPDDDGVCEVPGELWTEGFSVILAYNAGNTLRKALCDILAYNVQNDIAWLNPALVSVVSQPVAWAKYMPVVRSNILASYILGWLADFPDPHNWMIPFMHSQGDFGRYQNVDYSVDPESLNWYQNTYGPLPYHNYKNDLVTALSTDYVDSLINKGIQLPDTPGPHVKGDGSRQELYEELMDIFFAHAATMMTVQATGRHYERDWLCGWIDNPIRPGYYAYELWKQDVATQVWDVSVIGYASYNTATRVLTKNIKIHNYANVWRHVWFSQCVIVVLPCIYNEVANRIWYNHCELLHFWIPPHATITIIKIITMPGPIPAGGRILITHWVGFDYMRTSALPGDLILAQIQDQDPMDNMSPMPFYTTTINVGELTIGDLGSGVPAKFFVYDGIVDGKDKALFLLIYKGQTAWQKLDRPTVYP